MKSLNGKYSTLLLLCLGYFIDFYDLTIMGVSYSELIKEQFTIHSITQIQQTYLLISNFQTLGIFIGALIFGVLGDKLGRATTIKYSILIYSLATILAIFTHSLPVFIVLRMLAYMGLATEFSTSTVLILELFPVKSASWSSAFLYSFGVLGGITATLIGFYSWQIMFLIGGVAGLLLFLARGKIKESPNFLKIQQTIAIETRGNFKELLSSRIYLWGLFKYLLIILPYYAIITMMFIFPNYIIKEYSLAYATKILLMGFFVGNIIGSLFSAYINNYFKNYKAFMQIMLGGFLILMLTFPTIREKYILIFSIGLGIVGGGYPISWAQYIAREFPIHIRSLASNCLFALGRGSSIVFNTFISLWIAGGNTFKINSQITIIIVFMLALFSLLRCRNNYQIAIDS